MGLKEGQKSDGMLRSYLVFQHINSGAGQAVCPPGPKATLLVRVSLNVSVGIPRRFLTRIAVLSPAPPGQFLLEESRLLEAAEMAEKAARLDSGEFDVVFSAAHMLR